MLSIVSAITIGIYQRLNTGVKASCEKPGSVL